MTESLRPTILRFGSLDSTNLEALRQAKIGAPEGLCIVAREQTRGRGRLDRSWQSPKDAGLYFSVILRPRISMNTWPLIPLMSGLAVADALMRAANLRVDIKWPNDICVGQRKLAGILVESAETNVGPAAIVGIGINLGEAELPAEVRALATSVEREIGSRLDAHALERELVRAIAERYDILQGDNGPEHTIREWCASSSYAYDRLVRVSLNGETVEGTTRGLDNDGALRVERSNGEVKAIRAGDVVAVRISD